MTNEEMLAQALRALSKQEQDEDAFGAAYDTMTPEQRALQFKLYKPQEQALREQLMMAQELRNAQPGNYRTPGGALFGGMGSAFKNIMGSIQGQESLNALKALGEQQSKDAQARYEAQRAAGASRRNMMAPTMADPVMGPVGMGRFW